MRLAEMRVSQHSPSNLFRPSLMLAHAMGFGLYSEKGIVQILENQRHWEDLGYEVTQGKCVPGERVVIQRPAENSPVNISAHAGAGHVIEARIFDAYAEEIDWVVKEFKTFIHDGLRPQDILVVSLDDRNTKRYFSDIAKRVLTDGVDVNNLSLPSFDVPNFFVEGAVTLSTVYKAKGNEAAVVFVVGLDAVAYELDEVRARNKVFAAFTRSRAWLRVSGTGVLVRRLFAEIDTAIKRLPYFEFTYPAKAAVRMIQRDLAERSGKLAELRRLVEELGLTNLSEEEVQKVLRGADIKK